MEEGWAHNPGVSGSNLASVIFIFAFLIKVGTLNFILFSTIKQSKHFCCLPDYCTGLYNKYLNSKYLENEQSGAVEACWAHSPEVSGSSLVSAVFIFAHLIEGGSNVFYML